PARKVGIHRSRIVEFDPGGVSIGVGTGRIGAEQNLVDEHLRLLRKCRNRERYQQKYSRFLQGSYRSHGAAPPVWEIVLQRRCRLKDSSGLRCSPDGHQPKSSRYGSFTDCPLSGPILETGLGMADNSLKPKHLPSF